jgi:hypothetical protein
VDDRLLRHERRYWRESAVAYGLRPALSESTLWDALAVAMLFGTEDRDNADALLRHLPALADQSRDRRDTVRTWITSLYPPIDARSWGSLQPDRLAERFVGTRLAATAELPDPLLAAATPAQVQQLLTVYARAANHPATESGLDAGLTALCIQHSRVLALPAIDAATQVEAPAPLIAALRHLTTDPDVALDALIQMADRLPRSSHNLAKWAAELSQRVVDEHRQLAGEDPEVLPELARLLNNLSVRLGDLGQREKALTTIQEAVTTYRQLAEKWPDAHQRDLDQSLLIREWLQGLGRESEPPPDA